MWTARRCWRSTTTTLARRSRCLADRLDRAGRWPLFPDGARLLRPRSIAWAIPSGWWRRRPASSRAPYLPDAAPHAPPTPTPRQRRRLRRRATANGDADPDRYADANDHAVQRHPRRRPLTHPRPRPHPTVTPDAHHRPDPAAGAHYAHPWHGAAQRGGCQSRHQSGLHNKSPEQPLDGAGRQHPGAGGRDRRADIGPLAWRSTRRPTASTWPASRMAGCR